MAVRLTWRPEETAAIAEQVALVLHRGGIAVVPTESGMEAIAWGLKPEAVARLAQLAGDEPLSLALRGHAELSDWLPAIRGRIAALARKQWPGPLGMLLQNLEASQVSRLPETTFRRLVSERGVPFRIPATPLIEGIHSQLGGPLVIAAVSPSAEADIVVDPQPSVLAPAPVTWIEATPTSLKLVRQGAVPPEDLIEDSACSILFLCTGNTCRSPMAAGLCRMLLAQALGCPEADVVRHGFRVQSAGLSAMMGQTASEHALAVAKGWGADLSEHRSQRLTGPLFYLADHVFAMTRSHLDVLESIPPQPGSRQPRLLSPYNEDIADPYGGEAADYQACSEQILECLRLRLPEILES